MKLDAGGPIPAIVLALSCAGCHADTSGPTSFTITCQPGVLAMDESTARVSCLATSLHAFAATALFRCASQPSGMSCTFNPPSVTVKEFLSQVSQGYPNPRPNTEPARFPTVIQIVPAGAP